MNSNLSLIFYSILIDFLFVPQQLKTDLVHFPYKSIKRYS